MNQTLPSGPVAMWDGKTTSGGLPSKKTTSPVGVIRPTWLPAVVNQMLPSAPGASASGPQASPPPTGKLVMSPLVVMRPMRSPRLVNHNAPSPPVTMVSGASISPAGSRYRVSSPPGVMRPSLGAVGGEPNVAVRANGEVTWRVETAVWVGEGCHARLGALSSYYRHREGRRHRRGLRFRHRRIPTASASGEDNRYQRRGADRCCKYKRKTSRTRSLQGVRTRRRHSPSLGTALPLGGVSPQDPPGRQLCL